MKRYLFEIFFYELDITANKFFNSLNSSVNIFYSSNFRQVFPSFSRSSISVFFPIKLTRLLYKFHSLKYFFNLKKKDFINKFTNLFHINYLKNFTRKIFYTRYLDNFIMGVIGSNKFSNYIKSNFIRFLRSRFHTDVREIEIFQSKNIGLFFCGFNISIFEKKFLPNFSLSSIQIKLKYGNRLITKLSYFRRKLLTFASERLYSELFFGFQKILELNNKKFLSSDQKFLWTYIFQLEAVRSFQYQKLLLTNDSLELPSDCLLLKLKESKNFSYSSYYFNLFFSKQKFFMNEILKNSSLKINNSVFPFDMKIELLLKEFIKKIHICNEGFVMNDVIIKRIIDIPKNFYYFYGLKFTRKDIFDFRRSFSFNTYGNLRQKFIISLNFPSIYLFNKFRSLGFIHLKKNRPIGNHFYFSLEDNEIINRFGYIANILLHWFRCCNNFSKVKFLVEFLRRSCFLTLCRKHNKSKNWGYSVYTPNLLVSSSLFNKNSYFPSKNLVYSLKSKFLLKKKIFYFFDEEFILN